MIPGNGVCNYKGVGVHFADFISFILKYGWMKLKQFGLSETKLSNFIGYLK